MQARAQVAETVEGGIRELLPPQLMQRLDAAEKRIEVPEHLLDELLTAEQKAEVQENDLHVTSVTVTAVKP